MLPDEIEVKDKNGKVTKIDIFGNVTHKETRIEVTENGDVVKVTTES